MEFKRARSREQKELRKQQIKSQATKLLIDYGYDHISFVRIAEDLSIKRPLIYTYYSNVADILLDSLADKWDNITAVLKDANPQDGGYDALEIILDIVLSDEEIINLVLIYNTVLEPACSTTALLDYELRYKLMHDQVDEFIKHSHPHYTKEVIESKYFLFWSLLLGMLNVTCRSEKQRVAKDAVGSPIPNINIKKELTEIIHRLDV